MHEHVLLFRLDPVAKGRPRFSRGHAYTPEKTRNFEQAARMIARGQFKYQPFKCPLSANIKFFMRRPKSANRDYPTTRPDIENLAKGIIDACNGVVWEDDSLICDLSLSKRYAVNQPYIELAVSVLP